MTVPAEERQTAHPPIDPRTLYAFVESRIKRGMFDSVAFSRVARSISTLGRSNFPPAGSDDRPALRVRPVPFGQAAAFCAVYHRHLKPPVGHVFSLGVFVDRLLVGVAIVGRPVARLLDDGRTLEITRVAADGTRNACSALLGACRREARRRSITRLVTYTLPIESGVSLRAAGFRLDGRAGGGRWDRGGRPRADGHPVERKLRWVA
jgi:hypothetical protein